MPVSPLSPIGASPVTSLGAFGGVSPLPSADPTSGAGPATATTGAAATSGSFASSLARGLEHVEGLQATSDQLAVQAATGTLTNVHDYMIASTEASLATELTVAVRNKAVEAFNDIMRMPV